MLPAPVAESFVVHGNPSGKTSIGVPQSFSFSQSPLALDSARLPNATFSLAKFRTSVISSASPGPTVPKSMPLHKAAAGTPESSSNIAPMVWLSKGVAILLPSANHSADNVSSGEPSGETVSNSPLISVVVANSSVSFTPLPLPPMVQFAKGSAKASAGISASPVTGSLRTSRSVSEAVHVSSILMPSSVHFTA